MSPTPSLEEVLGVAGPAYLRKVNRNHWGHSADGVAEGRVSTALDKIFKPEKAEEGYSHYLAETYDELLCVALAMNADRGAGHHRDTFDVVAFTPQEAEQAGIRFKPTPGDTPCWRANVLHRDMDKPTRAQLDSLCRIAMGAGREAKRLGRTHLDSAIYEACKHNCPAAPDRTGPCTGEWCREAPVAGVIPG